MDVCPAPLCLTFLLCIAASSSDVGSDPHMHIEGYQDGGIKITCTAERWNPAPELLWQDDGGKNLSAASEKIIPDENGLLKVETSFIASSNKKVSCLLRDRAQDQDKEATLYIAETFFHRVSRCGISCPVIGISFALVWICLIVLVGYLFKHQKWLIGNLQNRKRDLKDELEWRRKRIYEDDVTLDRETASPNLSVTEDCKSVSPCETASSKIPEMFDRTNTVLGRKEFTDGQHYWEVDVTTKTGWMLGVLEDKSGDMTHWGLSLYKNKYKSLTKEKSIERTVGVKLTKVGVFVDCTDHTVSFYSVDRKSKLFTLTGAFTRIKPFLDPGYYEPENRGALTICSVPEWD